MTGRLYRLGRYCAEHGWRVIAIWVLLAVAIIGSNRAAGGEARDDYKLPGADSLVAQNLLNRAFPGTSAEAIPLVLHAEDGAFRTPAGAAAVDEVVTAVAALPAVTMVGSPADFPELISDDGGTAVIRVTLNERQASDTDVAGQLLATAQDRAGEQVQVALGGFAGAQLSAPDTHKSEAIGLFAAIVVLFLTLRTVSATAIPLISAVVAVGLGLALVGLISNVAFVPEVAPTLGTMLGLGVGIDYALFLITRHRTLLRQGYDVADAVGRTCGTAGVGMVFAGGTLMAAVCGLAFTGISYLTWLGLAAAMVVAVAVVASITLVPAILGVLGHRVLPDRQPELREDEHLDTSGWARLADEVTGRPWLYAIVSTAVLLLLASPTLTLTLGHGDAGNLPTHTTARQSYDLVSEGFGPGDNGPLAIVTEMYARAEAPADAQAPGDPRAQDPRLQGLQDELAATPGIVDTAEPVVSPDGGVAVVRVTPQWGPSDPQTEQLVHDLRDEVLPEAVTGTAMAAHVGGVTAVITDFSEFIAKRTPFFIFGVVSLSFLLLMLAYRSLLIPFKAACMNLLSIAAAYGIVVVVFQWGWGAHLIGLAGPVPIESYIPMMMFAVLFGLSMDYEVFLLTAFREHWARTGDMTTSVRRGLADTGRLVTAAALIMVAVFGSFILSDNAVVKMFGVGLSSAVAIDATIVRCLLVPAIMVLAQRGTWWLPQWLDRLLPQLHVEGDPRAIDALAGRRSPADTSSTPLARYRPRAIVGAAIGVTMSWLLVSALPFVPVAGSTAAALSALFGAVLALLPTSVGGRGSLLQRASSYLLGVVIGLVVLSALAAATTPVEALATPITAYAVLITALIAVLLVGRNSALPLVLGAAAITMAYMLGGRQSASLQVLLTVSLLPALVTMLVISVFGTWLPGQSPSSEQPHEEPTPVGGPDVLA